MTANEKSVFVILRGSVVLSTGKKVPIEIHLNVPKLTPYEESELESMSVVLHDLTPFEGIVPTEWPIKKVREGA